MTDHGPLTDPRTGQVTHIATDGAGRIRLNRADGIEIGNGFATAEAARAYFAEMYPAIDGTDGARGWRSATEGETAEWHAGHLSDGLTYRETEHGVEVCED